ncbi:pyruvate formate-lyase 2-activating enzyme [Bacilli bacterium]|nr:pyruvate formate-lyase 2-activating enzyme [Bacilli bacterium]
MSCDTLKGLIFNIQRYSIHDGSGIRTLVFFKGCPLACPWCSNPESRQGVMPTTWIKNGKREVVGEWLTVAEVIKEVLKDEIFFRTSGGGVTLSGGEVLMQAPFAQALLQALSELGIETAIETTGCFDKERLGSLLPYLNQVLFDFKIMAAEPAKRVIGIDVETVKANFELICQHPEISLTPRIPLIPGFTANPENLLSIINYLKHFQMKEVHLLPFHQYGSSKYDNLGWTYEMKDVPTLLESEIAEMQALFEMNGLTALVDGLE